MIEQDKRKLGATLWAIADQLRGAVNADDFRDCMLSLLFLRYLSDNYDEAARKERIRTKLLKDGHIDTVIGLPANLFFSTGIPVCVLVLKKCKKPDDVLFINAADHFEKGKRQNVLMPEHIDKIIDTYQYRREEERYARRVSMKEIEENGYNLNITRYISTQEAEDQIDLRAVNAELVGVTQKIEEARERHNAFLRELGLPPV